MMEHVVLLHDQPTLTDNYPSAYAESEILFTVQAVHDCLADAGFDVSFLSVARDPDPVLAALRQLQPDVVFNLCEGSTERPDLEAMAASLLEWLDIPFTGCPALALHLCVNKPLTKKLLGGAGIPTPEFFVVNRLPVPACRLPWPLIVKPSSEDGSIGIDQDSVVTAQAQLEDRVAYLLNKYKQPVLVEQFLAGRELKVGLIELPDLQTLPIAEIEHIKGGPGFWPIVTYSAKWEPGSRDDVATPRCFPRNLAADLSGRLQRFAREVFRLFGCRDFASVDFRLDKFGNPCVIDVNPNPDFSPHAGFAVALQRAGWSYPRFTVELVHNALRRRPGTRLTDSSWADASLGGSHAGF
jgi:D-alanine-D-alanine ligase